MTTDSSPPFPTYLLPSVSFPTSTKFSISHEHRVRRRQSSTASTSDYMSSPSLSTSPVSVTWSPTTTPNSSPHMNSYFPANHNRNSISSLTSSLASTSLSRFDSNITSSGTRVNLTKTTHHERTPLQLTKSGPDTLKCQTCSTDLAFTSQIVSKGFTGRHGRAYLLAPPPTVSTQEFTTSRSQSTFPSQSAAKSRPGHFKNATHFDSAPDLINVTIGRVVQRQLVTGVHVVADISCVVCGVVVGWKYVDAREASQRYKIGKFILECKRVVCKNAWEDESAGTNDAFVGESEEGPEAEDPDSRSSGVLNMDTAGKSIPPMRKDLSRQLGPGSARGLRELDGELRKEEGKGWKSDEILVFDSQDESECEDLFAGVWDAEKVRVRRARKAKMKK